MKIKFAFPNEFNIIKDLAERIWPVTYGEIISSEQIDYMMGMMYSIETLNANHEKGVEFLLVEEDGKYLGFSAFQHDFKEKGRSHVQKIYVLPEAQGKNIGRMLMHFMERQSLEKGAQKMTLNVNRFNKARHFYAKLGYEVVETVNIEIGNGYLMEDFVMEKTL
ncbi:MAG: GNAT family N-acetyltransferase [Flavobacterium sp.]|uniref:GNAT family N-acetyltransferase n=1 Tax=Flavobacterium sp. TaxID=239 RepID=UPI0012095D5D|nr:GNAT family N-acetyltransferase [Flavobacterium sp.]RZJ68258.1 MAG: GNAT family N-acetyltransferase [Flavobacterium sp.]